MQNTTPQAIYFCHGVPGSAHDARLMKHDEDGPILLTPNMFSCNSADPVADAIAQFDKLSADFSDQRINVVGFSIGAMVAIKIAAARPKRVGQLTLISPAAPLDLGDFLPHMAGAAVFKLAMKHPKVLKALTSVQGFILRVWPNFLINQLFAKCGNTEKQLLNDPEFLSILRQSLLNSFCKHPDTYLRFVQHYVGNWSGDLGRITCPVEIWHGAKDTWSPLAMSQAICDAVSGSPILHIVPDGEHYSTLTQVILTRID